MGRVMAAETMAERNQVTLTLSDKAWEEFRLVAEWKGMPVATMLRNVIENHHQSPGFGNLVRRARSGSEAKDEGFRDERD